MRRAEGPSPSHLGSSSVDGPLADPVVPVPLAHVEMDMVLVGAVGARTEHRPEAAAGALLNGLPQRAGRAIGLGQADDPAVLESTSPQIERIAGGMLADEGARDAVARPAGLAPTLVSLTSLPLPDGRTAGKSTRTQSSSSRAKAQLTVTTVSSATGGPSRTAIWRKLTGPRSRIRLRRSLIPAAAQRRPAPQSGRGRPMGCHRPIGAICGGRIVPRLQVLGPRGRQGHGHGSARPPHLHFHLSL